MRRLDSRNTSGVVLLFIVTLAMVLPACREEGILVDRNRAPETFLTVAPPETTNADYLVHLYWHGEDKDGVVTRYMWFRSDTLRTLKPYLESEMELLDWNPEARASDYVRGHFTMATDTIITFKGYDDNTGALLNRQAFHIVALDDMGRMDQTPARIQFFAKVDCVPVTKFWTSHDGIDWTTYESSLLDTISMFQPVHIRFWAETCNDHITGYRWIYGGKVYPDENNDGVPEWKIPPPETLTVSINNDVQEFLPSGDLYLKVLARDDAGSVSKANILTGEGVCQIVINHDPDTRILYGDNYFTMQSGDTAIRTIEFSDGAIDTLPYNSRLRLHYMGWDDTKDILEYDPPLPIRFQYMFERWGRAFDGSSSNYSTPWYPTKKAEDTNCYADEDSVTMRVGSNEYIFAARAFDEQYRSDGTPDTVRFYGNYSPNIDQAELGIYSPPFSENFIPITSDTLYINIATPMLAMGDTCNAYSVSPNPETGLITYFYRFLIKASGHDDRRDPPDSGIRSWMFSIETEEDYYYRKEEEWISDFPVNEMEQECIFKLVVPADSTYSYMWPDSSFVSQQPGWMGDQVLVVYGKDIRGGDWFDEGIRCVSPSFDPDDPCEMTSLGSWCTSRRYPSNYARSDSRTINFYIKLIYFVP